MRIFVAGATGVIGKRFVPLLVGRGHEVIGMTRSRQDEAWLREIGAEAAFADGLDRDAVVAAVSGASPEVVVHEMTGLLGVTSLKRWDDEYELTNRLRTEGTDHLIEAARRAGARRFVAQSFGNWNYARTGGPVKTEDDPLDPDPPPSMRRSLAAIKHLESVVLRNGTGPVNGMDGMVLRYANLYGPGTAWSEDGAFVNLVRQRKLPLIGGGGGVWSFVHIDDMAIATVAGIERGAPGIYNIADDEPAPVRVWLPFVARVLGAKPPWHVPAWIGQFAVGEAGISIFTEIRGASNAKAKRELGWRLTYPSWREGFEQGLANAPMAPAAADGLLALSTGAGRP